MRLPGDALYSMENHSTALNVWERHGVQDAQCVHLDAHLDAGWFSTDAATTRNTSALSSSELKERDCFLHTKEGHFDISSWIGVALFRRHVSRLFWVVPDEVWFQNSRRLQELLSRQVGHVTLDSYLQISGSGSPYRFVLESTEIIVCRLAELPSMETGTLLLDVDLDYFARYHPAPSAENWSQPWTDPRRVVLDLQTRVPQASITTVSVSWHGGYVPNELMPYVLPLTEGSDQIVDGDVWDRHDDRLFGPYADYTRACGLLHRNLPAEAAPFARRAAAAAPDVGAYQYAVALCSSGIGDLLGAAAAMDECLSSGSIESAQVLNDFAGIYARLGSVNDALHLQEKAANLDMSGSPIISGNLMALYAQTERWDRAQRLAYITLERQPFNVESWAVLATAAQHHGDMAGAAESWAQAARATLPGAAQMAYRRRAARIRRKMKAQG